jgi:hypothetical protein
MQQEGDCQIPRSESGRASKELLFQDRKYKLADLSTIDKYNQAIRHELPFIPADCLHATDTPLFWHCVDFAARLSIYHGNGNYSLQDIEYMTELMSQRTLTEQELAGTLLLLPRICLDYEVVEKVGS